MGKLATPDWIREGYDSKADWEKAHGDKSAKKEKKVVAKKEKGSSAKAGKERTFKLKVCPKCKSDKVGIVLVGEERKSAKEWECAKCKWKGKEIDEKELSEDEFMEYLDKKGEDVA